MSATFSKLGPLSVEATASGFSPHIEELHAFFKTRTVAYGSPDDLGPFVDRLDSDSGFRDEIASMMRTIIYRERDGLSWAELMELLAAAVGGPGVDDATAPEVREAVRRLLAFVEGIFRTRRNPGAASVGAAVQVMEPEVAEPEVEEPEAAAIPVAQEAVTHKTAESAEAEHPKIDMFYRARMVAEEEAAEPPAGERRIELEEPGVFEEPTVKAGATATEAVLHSDLNWKVPFEDFEDRGTAERGSPAWLWVAGCCALLLAFCAGLFVHQRLMVPLRDPNTPYEKLPPETANPAATTTAAASNAQPAATDKAAADSVPARALVVRPSAANVQPSGSNLRPKYLAPATIGASAGAMESRLVYAPPPSYPMMAEMTRIQGSVMVEAVVGKSGRVIRAQAVSGHHLLRGAAVREVYGRRYRPYTVNERPVSVATIVTVDFRLRR
jgi:outer membrane biosynthesis protein TonB